MGCMTTTTGMMLRLPLRSGVHVAVDAVVMVGVMMLMMPLLLSCLLVPLSRWYVGRRFGRLRPPVLLSWDGAELCQGDGRWRGGRLGPPAGLRAWVQQGRPGLLPPVLEGLRPMGVDSESILSEGPGIGGGDNGLPGWNHIPTGPTGSPTALARRPGLMANSLCARPLLDRRRSVLLGHVRLWKVIRISQSSCIGAQQHDGSL